MKTLEAIFTRRSVRNFRPDPVSKDDLHDLLKAGMQAPSARNAQPWHFVVIDDLELLHAIPNFHPYSAMLMEAPLAILVCSDRSLQEDQASWLQDCSAATENILLAAHAKGLGGVWLGIIANPERTAGMKALVKLPENISPVSLIAIGHPAFHPEPEERFREDRVHYNQW